MSFLVFERLEKSGMSTTHGPYDTATATLQFIENAASDASLFKIEIPETSEPIDYDELRGQAAVEKAAERAR